MSTFNQLTGMVLFITGGHMEQKLMPAEIQRMTKEAFVKITELHVKITELHVKLTEIQRQVTVLDNIYVNGDEPSEAFVRDQYRYVYQVGVALHQIEQRMDVIIQDRMGQTL